MVIICTVIRNAFRKIVEVYSRSTKLTEQTFEWVLPLDHYIEKFLCESKTTFNMEKSVKSYANIHVI